MPRPFRFGVVAPFGPTADLAGPGAPDRGRRLLDAADAGFPLAATGAGPPLATAAAVTDLRVGTWVYAAPLRPAWLTAWEAHSLSQLTDGRFELASGSAGRGSRTSSARRECPCLAGPAAGLVRETVERSAISTALGPHARGDGRPRSEGPGVGGRGRGHGHLRAAAGRVPR